ncbi:tRNA lysidine(34) synthetase TilS [Martelella endophytica]|uniref:tRNA lysidine(34) synthetase TilS n=1 Tax=Martelella endophytica TaxID=1486262 RepID=UPI0005F2771D|nr:tRNA lysidine(34) synthetase TilS [Martelella endophytica]
MAEDTSRTGSEGSAAALEAARRFVVSLKTDCHVLVAVSGGSDSLGLLVALGLARQQAGRPDIRISAATVDHRLRRGSAQEAAVVGHFCHSRGLDHQTLVWSGEKPEAGMMDAARRARYALLAAHASQIGADVIAVGHTLNDQVETFVMRMHRSSEAVTAVMADHTLLMGQNWLARPFLDVRRDAIRALLEERGIAWSNDPSNDDMRYERVRVRKALADEAAVEALSARVGAQLEERTRLACKALDLFEGSCRIYGRTVAELDVGAMMASRDAARYLANVIIRVFGGRPHGPGTEVLEDALALAAGPSGERMTAGRCLFEKRGNSLFILREKRDLPDLFVPAGAVELWDGRWQVDNRSLEPVVVRPASVNGPGDVPHVFAGLPARIGNLAAAVQPSASGQGALSAVGLSPAFAPFDRFLPGVDVRLANGIASRFGHPGYALPLRVYLR